MSAKINDEDSLSSDSDDGFLTERPGAQSKVDREALVRKKLLESFYGKSAVNKDGDTGGIASQWTEDDDEDEFGGKIPAADPKVVAASRNNLDSPYFDAAAHTARHVAKSSVQELLETEENLACQVRTLDSSMQTLVYENYARFMDATDALRSIGVHVQANENGLKRLQSSMETIHDHSRNVESAVGTLRDSVVEKLRVKRLLTRLDTLLKLPKTLQQQILEGKYRLAMQSYLSAHAILSKHTASFPSLQAIEEECQVLLIKMLEDVQRKLIQWCGNDPSVAKDIAPTGSNDSETSEDGPNRVYSADLNDNDYDDYDFEPIEPPETVSAIFECAGAPVLVMSKTGDADKKTSDEKDGEAKAETGTELASKFESKDCKDMALSAALRWLERVLDIHHIELQEAKFSDTPVNFSESKAAPPRTSSSGTEHSAETIMGTKLVPIHVLDSILQAATLYGSIFGSTFDDEDRGRLNKFVSEAYATFLMHVRSAMLEHAAQAQSTKALRREKKRQLKNRSFSSSGALALEEAANSGAGGEEESQSRDESHDTEIEQMEGDEIYEEIATSMSTLMQAVRQVAAGLSLPEVGVDSDITSSLIDQTVSLNESLVRNRVDHKFYDLRLKVVNDCLTPFLQASISSPSKGMVEVMSVPGETADTTVLGIVQKASVALSDSLQLVDDTIRSVFLEIDTEGSSVSTSDDAMVQKKATESSARRFVLWLAIALEVLAGCESGDPKTFVEVEAEAKDGAGPYEHLEDGNDDEMGAQPIPADDMSIASEEQTNPAQLVEAALYSLVDRLEASTSKEDKSNITLAIAEMCRVAERSVMDSVLQSIATHSGGGKHRKTKNLFPTPTAAGDDSSPKQEISSDPASQRFHLAASRVLSLYATNYGFDAAILLSKDIDLINSSGGLSGPRSQVCSALEVVKTVSVECSLLFGGPKCAGPVPDAPEDELAAYVSRQAARLGVALDVERIFSENVVIFPHPNAFISAFSRDFVISIVLKTAFKALMEHARSCVFDASGYRQLVVDVEFLKFMLPHYVSGDFQSEGSDAQSVLYSLLSDVLATVAERCKDIQIIREHGEDATVNEARATIREFMADGANADGILKRFTIEEG